MRREHIVAFIVLAWSGHARASDTDVAIDRASTDLKCDELQMMHAKNQYAFVGCGKRRLYECADGKCDDVTNRKAWAPGGACVGLLSANVAPPDAHVWDRSGGPSGISRHTRTQRRDACTEARCERRSSSS
jgi:hypothetical protein